MTPESKSRAGLPSDAEARAIMNRARRLRAELLASMARAVWSRIARRPAGVPAGAHAAAMPHANA